MLSYRKCFNNFHLTTWKMISRRTERKTGNLCQQSGWEKVKQIGNQRAQGLCAGTLVNSDLEVISLSLKHTFMKLDLGNGSPGQFLPGAWCLPGKCHFETRYTFFGH